MSDFSSLETRILALESRLEQAILAVAYSYITLARMQGAESFRTAHIDEALDKMQSYLDALYGAGAQDKADGT